MAVKGGATRVYACDQSHVMVKLSHDIITANQMEDKVASLQMHTNDLHILKDIPEQRYYIYMYTVYPEMFMWAKF